MHHQTKTVNVMYQPTPFALLSLTLQRCLGKTQANIHNFKDSLSVLTPTVFCSIPAWSHHRKSEHYSLLHILDIKENQIFPFWIKSLRWEHCLSESSPAELCKRSGGRGWYSNPMIFGCKFRKEKAKTSASSC